MYTYTVYLTNFNTDIYSGSDLAAALHKAAMAGFETTLETKWTDDEVHGSGVSYRYYSPISGWK